VRIISQSKSEVVNDRIVTGDESIKTRTFRLCPWFAPFSFCLLKVVQQLAALAAGISHFWGVLSLSLFYTEMVEQSSPETALATITVRRHRQDRETEEDEFAIGCNQPVQSGRSIPAQRCNGPLNFSRSFSTV
jgi:hypothetical protein